MEKHHLLNKLGKKENKKDQHQQKEKDQEVRIVKNLFAINQKKDALLMERANL